MVIQSHMRKDIILKLKSLPNRTTVRVFMATANKNNNKFIDSIPQICITKAKVLLVIYFPKHVLLQQDNFTW